jgi:hypothetical protein
MTLDLRKSRSVHASIRTDFPPNCAAWSGRESNQIAAGFSDGHVRVFDSVSREILQDLDEARGTEIVNLQWSGGRIGLAFDNEIRFI